MKTMKVLLLIACLVLIASNTFVVAAANSLPGDPWPDCGIHTLNNPLPHDYGNVYIDLIWPAGELIITSSNGWEIIEVYWWVSSGNNIYYIYPPGTTSVTVPIPNVAATPSISLEKDCAARPKCKPTGRFVYTLFGNYVCNLVTEEKSIPARFLNPEYTGPLCNLPDLDHTWNGDWVKNKEMDCGDYYTGGNHYDTGLQVLP